jgi:hypothetical protein
MWEPTHQRYSPCVTPGSGEAIPAMRAWEPTGVAIEAVHRCARPAHRHRRNSNFRCRRGVSQTRLL